MGWAQLHAPTTRTKHDFVNDLAARAVWTTVIERGGGREKQIKQACVVVRTAALGSLFQAVPKRVQRTEGTEQKKKKMRSLLKNASFISNLYERKKRKKKKKKISSRGS